jgi:hypothetical protein
MDNPFRNLLAMKYRLLLYRCNALKLIPPRRRRGAAINLFSSYHHRMKWIEQAIAIAEGSFQLPAGAHLPGNRSSSQDYRYGVENNVSLFGLHEMPVTQIPEPIAFCRLPVYLRNVLESSRALAKSL